MFTNKLTAGLLVFEDRTMGNTAGSNNPSAMATVAVDFGVNGPLGGGLAALNMFLSPAELNEMTLTDNDKYV